MFIIRQAKLADVATLLKLARMVHFINLPADKDIITGKALHSAACFRRAAGQAESAEEAAPAAADARNGHDSAGLGESLRRSDLFMFVLEEVGGGGCLGTSQITAHMGGPGHPNYSLKLTRREFFSTTLQTGTTQTVAQLYADETGPTEIGGLILQPASRGHKLGRFLSFVRFHFIGLFPHLFSERVIAEMMAPITLDGQNMLWEYFGRRFIPLSYTEADKHCQRSREFIWALLPHEEIYLSLLPPEARDVIGRVGEETVPARRMLERLGFRYRDLVDPFDGGPHLEAVTKDISVVRDTRRAELGEAIAASEATHRAIVSRLDADGEFRAVDALASFDRHGRVRIPEEVMEAAGFERGGEVGVTPLETLKSAPAEGSAAAPRKGGRKKASTTRSRKKVQA